MSRTVVEKIAEAHASGARPDRPLRAGDYVSIRPTRAMTHDNSAPVIEKFLRLGAKAVHDPDQIVFTLDHDIQNRSATNLAKFQRVEAFAKEHGIEFHPAGSGIGHQIMVESLHATPGAFVVAADSHANLYGALGAVGTPVVRSDAAAIWATGEFWWRIPRTVQCRLEGRLPMGVSGKDLILTLCSRFQHGEVLGAAVEFCGSGVSALTVDDRLTISNMTTEWGALSGWFPVDEICLSWIRGRREQLGEPGLRRASDRQLHEWADRPPGPDSDANYSARIRVDLSSIEPHVSGPNSVQLARPVSKFTKNRIRIDKAYLVSCVNARESDLSAAAEILRGRSVADHVEFYIAAASRSVEHAAARSGVWQTLLDAGARPLPPGCGPCIGLGEGTLQPGETGISATNRNFRGRMGSPEATGYLASPRVVAASAAAGYICGPEAAREVGESSKVGTSIEWAAEPERVRRGDELIEGFPCTLSGRAVLLPADHIDTDAIYGKDFTYRDQLTPNEMAQVVFRNLDPGLADRLAPGDVLLTGYHFGYGSSREQAVTALQHAGIAAVIAGSYSETYLRNAYNCGFLCLESPALADFVKADFAAANSGNQSVQIDFRETAIQFAGKRFEFRGLDRLPQELIVVGGLENRIRETLARDDDRG